MKQPGRHIRLGRLEALVASIVPEESVSPKTEAEWLEMFQQIAKDRRLQVGPEFHVAVRQLADALDHPGAADPPADFRPGEWDRYRRRHWALAHHLWDVNTLMLWLLTLTKRALQKLPPLPDQSNEWDRLRDWVLANFEELKQHGVWVPGMRVTIVNLHYPAFWDDVRDETLKPEILQAIRTMYQHYGPEAAFMISKRRLQRIEEGMRFLDTQPLEPANPYEDASPQEWLELFDAWSIEPDFAKHRLFQDDLASYRQEVEAEPPGVRHGRGIGLLRFYRDRVLIYAVGIWREQEETDAQKTPASCP